MNEFVDECRREWRRLGVPDPVANEMAADLTADLDEAEAEGGSPEDVLGTSAFDPRRFAAAWAAARGVTSPPILEVPAPRPTPWAIALTVCVGVVIVLAGLALFVGSSSRSVAVATRRIVPGPGPLRLLAPGQGRLVGPGRFILPIVGMDFHPLAWMLFLVGVVGLGLIAVVYWSGWSGLRRYRRHEGRRTPNWN